MIRAALAILLLLAAVAPSNAQSAREVDAYIARLHQRERMARALSHYYAVVGRNGYGGRCWRYRNFCR